MDRMLYIAMAGAKEAMLAQQVNTQNLANASTPGFRADLESMLSEPVYGPGFATRAYALSQDMKTMSFAQGGLEATGRDLDVAVNGDGWLVVQSPDGGNSLSRRGDLRISAEGLMTNGAGDPVMGNDGPIAIPPFETLEIGSDGTISIRPIGQPVNALAIIERILLVNPEVSRLDKGEDGKIRLSDGEVPVADAGVRLFSGTLEKSNVNSVQAMVRMIELQRHYELQVKMMATAKDLSESTQQLMRM